MRASSSAQPTEEKKEEEDMFLDERSVMKNIDVQDKNYCYRIHKHKSTEMNPHR